MPEERDQPSKDLSQELCGIGIGCHYFCQGPCQCARVFVVQLTTLPNVKVTVELCTYLTSIRTTRHIVPEESFELNALSHSMSNANS